MGEKKITHESRRSRHFAVSPARLVFAAFFVLAACDADETGDLPSNPPPKEQVRDFSAGAGSRLLPQYVTSADREAWRFLQIYDDQLGQPCRLVKLDNAEDTVRCQPLAYGHIVFLDSTCTTPYVATLQPEAIVGADGYSPHGGFVRVGARVMPRDRTRYTGGTNTACHEVTLPSDMPVYEISGRITIEDLAEGRFESSVETETLGAVMFRGLDGSTFVNELIDRTARVGCAPSITEAGPKCRALIGEVDDEGIRDLECKKLVVPSYDGGIGVARVTGRDGEYYRFLVYNRIEVGRFDSRGQCVVAPFDHGRTTLFSGVPYPAEEWPDVRIDTFGSDRLKAHVAQLPSGIHGDGLLAVQADRLFEDRGKPCGPVWVGDTLRCLPMRADQSYSWALVYADSSCTEPAVAIDPALSPEAFVTLKEGTAGGERGFLPIGRVLNVGRELAPEETFRIVPGLGECREAGFGAKYFALEDEVPAENFLELRLVTGRKLAP